MLTLVLALSPLLADPPDPRGAGAKGVGFAEAFYGGSDVVVPPATNVDALRRITATAGNDRVRIVVVPEGDHALHREGGSATAGDRGYWRFERFSPLVFEEILGFIRRL